MSNVKAIKSIKKRIEAKEYETAIYEATELLKKLDDKDPVAAQVLVFRGLALTYSDKKDEAEKCYLHAYRLDPSSPLASVGLKKLYQKDESWEKLGRFLEVIVRDAYDRNDAERCATTLQELMQLRQQHGPEDALYRTLALLLPSSPLISLLQPLPPSQGSYTPFPTPSYPGPSVGTSPTLPTPLPDILHLLNSLPLLLHLLLRSQALVHNKIETEVKARRTRLGAGTEKEVRKNVEGEVLSGELGMGMVEMLREVGGHPGVDEDVRRDVEVREFGFWRKLVGCLASEKAKPTKPATKPKTATISSTDTLPVPALFLPPTYPNVTRKEALSRTDGLAKGFVLLGIGGPGAEEGWAWVLEGKDEPTLFYELDTLHKFAKTFPQAPLTDFIDDYCRWFNLPLPEPEDEEVAPAATESGEGEAKKAVNKRKARKGRAGLNARERRKARRAAGKEGTLAEDVDQEERDELVGSMTKLLDKLPKSIFAHRVMARISIQEEDWANAIAYAEKGRSLLKELEGERGSTLPSVKASLDTALGVALVPYYTPKHHPRALRLLDGVITTEPSNPEARFARAIIYQSAERWEEARKEFQTLLDAGGGDKEMVSAKEEVGWCLVNEGKLEEGRDILEDVVQRRDSRVNEGGRDDEAFARARAWWRLGQTEWMIGDDESRGHAEEWFMASIRALPTYAPAFASLGAAYTSADPPDHARALKCYQQAFELDATQAEAARRLAMGYADEDEWASVRTIAVRVMEGEGGVEGVVGGEVLNAKGRFAPRNGWAWKALGSTEMHYKNYAKAASAYQIALRAEPDDVSTWTQLGESYLRAGRHMAALKALEHALELDSTHWMAYYHIGDIHSQLGSFDLAIDAYEKVSEMTGGKEIGVLAAIAGGMLSAGRQNAAGGFSERSRRAVRGAMQFAGDVLKSGEGHRPWGWKIIGDAAFELYAQESSPDDIKESAEATRPILQLLAEDDVDRRSRVDGVGHASNLLQATLDEYITLKTSVLAFAYRAHLLKNEPRVINSALYDLACSLHALAGALNDEGEKRKCIKGAMAAIRLALDRDAGDERFWDAFGVICAGMGDEVAQHAFVVSLELYAKDPITWTNLGYLYLRLDDLELANECFLKAQTIDPDYAKAWLGQGLLADRHGDKEHAKALFAHSVTLSAGSLIEADLAQAVSTFQPFLQPGSHLDTAILHQPAFSLRHYTRQRPRDSAAKHLYALICERIGLVEEAALALHDATQLLEEEFEATESEQVENKYIMALVNLGRVRLAGSEYAESKESYETAWELISTSTENNVKRMKVQCQVGLGIANYWLKEVEASLEAFESGMELSEGIKGLKEEVSVILARTLWELGGEDARETAKNHLLECLSQEKPPIKVISALAAIAIVSNDDDLIEATLSELESIPAERTTREDATGHTILARYAHALATNDNVQALQILENAVKALPTDEKARLRLAKALIQGNRPGEAVSALSKLEGKEGVELLSVRGIAELIQGQEEGMKTVQRAVRARPWDTQCWETLAWARGSMEAASVAPSE